MLRRSLCLLALLVFAAASGPASSQDAKKCRLQKVVEWKVRSIGRHMAVDGAINGKKIGIVLDTGAPRSVLIRASAKRLDLPISEVRGARARGVGGDSRIDVAVVDEFMLGEAVVRGMNFYVTGEHDPGEGFDLLLGGDFLRNFDIEFDLRSDAVRLWQPKDCEGASLAYWTKDVVGEVAITTPTYGYGHIQVLARLNGKPVNAIVDSGASTSMVSGNTAAAVGAIWSGTRGRAVGVGGGTVKLWMGRFGSFVLGNEDIPDVDIAIVEQDLPMLLGADFLRSHRTLVSHAQKKLYFQYVGGPVFIAGPSKPAAGQPAAEKAKAD